MELMHEATLEIASIPCGASVNQHHACADCVFVDVPSSANSMLQALHRLFRLGQRLTGNMVILTLDHSYDQAMQAHATKKMIGQVAGQGKIELTEEMRVKFLAKESKEEMIRGLTKVVHSEGVINCSTIQQGIAYEHQVRRRDAISSTGS